MTGDCCTVRSRCHLSVQQSQWLADHDEPHDRTRDTLVATERCLPHLQNVPNLQPQRSTQIGLLLGQTFTHANHEAHLARWPNGHPVIRTPITDIDVTTPAPAAPPRRPTGMCHRPSSRQADSLSV